MHCATGFLFVVLWLLIFLTYHYFVEVDAVLADITQVSDLTCLTINSAISAATATDSTISIILLSFSNSNHYSGSHLPSVL